MTAKLTLSDSTSIPPLNLTERSAAPSAPATGDIYLDDGTNTASGNPGFRRYTGATWEDISAGSGSIGGSTGATDNRILRADGTGGATIQSSVAALDDSGNLSGIANLTLSAMLNITIGSELTIATGAITVTGSVHSVDTESDAASDDLDTISGGASGDVIMIYPANTARTIVVKNGTGNIQCGADLSLDETYKAVTLQYDGSNWQLRAVSFDISGGGGMTSFSLAADSGTPETIADGNTLTVAGGTGIDTSVAATDTVTVAIDSTVATLTGSQTLTNKTLTTPTIGDFTNATHDHSNNAGGGTLAASAIASGTLAHERGGLEADVSAYDGLIRISGGATTNLKSNFAATAAPTVNDDSGDGYVVGSRWIDTTNDKEYVCLDNTLTAAVWIDTTQSGGGSGDSNIWDIILQDQKTAGTDGGSASATTTHTRVLNTEVLDVNNNCTLSSNQFTLDSGTYDILAFAPAWSVGQTKLRLRNITDSTYDLEGVSMIAPNGDSVFVNAMLAGRFTIASSKAFEIHHYCTIAVATWGLGRMVNQGTEIYTQVFLKKAT